MISYTHPSMSQIDIENEDSYFLMSEEEPRCPLNHAPERCDCVPWNFGDDPWNWFLIELYVLNELIDSNDQSFDISKHIKMHFFHCWKYAMIMPNTPRIDRGTDYIDDYNESLIDQIVDYNIDFEPDPSIHTTMEEFDEFVESTDWLKERRIWFKENTILITKEEYDGDTDHPINYKALQALRFKQCDGDHCDRFLKCDEILRWNSLCIRCKGETLRNTSNSTPHGITSDVIIDGDEKGREHQINPPNTMSANDAGHTV
eukprot:86776_1